MLTSDEARSSLASFLDCLRSHLLSTRNWQRQQVTLRSNRRKRDTLTVLTVATEPGQVRSGQAGRNPRGPPTAFSHQWPIITELMRAFFGDQEDYKSLYGSRNWSISLRATSAALT
jgi:hypothetical protein